MRLGATNSNLCFLFFPDTCCSFHSWTVAHSFNFSNSIKCKCVHSILDTDNTGKLFGKFFFVFKWQIRISQLTWNSNIFAIQKCQDLIEHQQTPLALSQFSSIHYVNVDGQVKRQMPGAIPPAHNKSLDNIQIFPKLAILDIWKIQFGF